MPLATCAALALAICPTSDRAAFNNSAEGIIAPPAWVWTAPTVHPKSIVVKRLENGELNKVCDTPGGLGGGCTFAVDHGICRIYMNAGYDPHGVRYKAVLHHEKAHCYGWPSDHSMTRPRA